jgi:Zn-dependent protease with chaperone function
MHFTMLLSIVALVWVWRYSGTSRPDGNWQDRWQHNLVVLLLPPLLLLVSSISILQMEPHGWMVWGWEGWVSYWLALLFVTYAVWCLIEMIFTGWRTIQEVRSYHQIELHGRPVRLLDVVTPYIAQIGFWHSELVVSKGLIDTLDTEHLQAVLAHEQAHKHYRDTFCFFWLGWFRQISIWLPNTQTIWEDLLALRELRADRWAAQSTDSLLLAETLLQVVQYTTVFADNYCAAFNQVAETDRLTQRIEALLAEAEPIEVLEWWQWSWLLLSFIPLLVVPLHQ